MNTTKTLFATLFAVVVLFAACDSTKKATSSATETKGNALAPNAMTYPASPKNDTKDDYFGTSVADPYRPLEDANSAETKAWVEAQNQLTFGYLDKIPFRTKLRERLTEMWNFEKFGVPTFEGGRYYFNKNDGLQNQAVLYAQDKLEGESTVILDPNSFSKDGTVALAGTSYSNTGKFLAYNTAEGGSDWNTVHVRDLSTGRDLPEHLEWVKFSSCAWLGDGFYYERYPAPKDGAVLSQKNEFHQVWFHKVGTEQAEDVLVFNDKEHPQRNISAQTTDDERFVILQAEEGTSGNNLSFRRTDAAGGLNAPFTPVVTTFDNDYTVIDNDGDILLVLTNNGAPNRRIIAIDTHNPAPDAWRTIVPEAKDVLQSVSICGGQLVCDYLHDVKSVVKLFDLRGGAKGEVTLPGIGIASGFSGKRDRKEAFYSFTGFTQPTTIYRYDVGTGKSEVFKAPKVKFDPSQYETKQVFYPSKDGTKIPMFITYKKGIKLDGKNPTWLYAYGGFNISVTPAFSISRACFMEQGGVFVVANIRGGGEYGEAWHKAGTKLQKQNVFDDFIAAAEYLIKEKYTSSQKLAIEGRSNGGLLIGACITQRPDLYKVALPGVGVMDMLRYHKFTIGWAWASDYGRSDDSKEMFEYLRRFSPVHNCRPAKYPATMIHTADHDDRVVPAHSFKFAAALQAANTAGKGTNPTLIRIDTKAGHGAGRSTKQVIEETTDLMSFVMFNLGMKM